MDEKIYHVISNTHWDREWRFSFQRNRQMLVDMIDAVLDILEKKPAYRAFHLDSQSIVLRDYTLIKPQNMKRIRKLVQENRLLIGPWYILPEEFQVGGENLIRNLLLGHRTSHEYGGVSKIGYSPFSWGQISQLPQIYKGFGINLIMFYRGINSLDSKYAEFLWEGADGTKSLSSRFSTMPRYNFYFYIYRPVVHNEGLYDIEYDWFRGGTPFHFADKLQADEDYFIINPADQYFEQNIVPQVEEIRRVQDKDFTTKHVIWMEGHDSSGPNAKTIRIINDIKKLFPGIKVIHSTLEHYADELQKSLWGKKLKLVKGERRSSQFDRRSGNLYGYTTSARMYLKQKNFESEKLLQYYAEPFNSISNLLGRDTNDKYIDTSWELLVQNSAHDSIGGCSLDDIHADMMNRYKHSDEIAKGVIERSFKHIIKNLDTSLLDKDINNEKIFLTVFNPNTFRRSEIIEAYIDIPVNLDKGSLQILDKNSQLAVEILDRKEYKPVVEQMIDRPMFISMFRYHVLFSAQDIPSLGYKTFIVNPVLKTKLKQKRLLKITSRQPVMENDYLKIKFNRDGTYNLTHKLLRRRQKNLAYFYDEGESGHAWVNKPLPPFYSTLNTKAKFEIIQNNSLAATVLVKHKLLLPINLDQRRQHKQKKVNVSVNLLVTIKRFSDTLEMKIITDNKIESHRLRVMFPTIAEASFSWGEGQFDVVRRPVKRINSEGWIEQPMYDYPMHQFVEVSSGKIGSAVFVRGLKEYEVKDDKNRTLAVTLIRGFENVIAPSSVQDFTDQKGSQCLGENTFELAYNLHAGDWVKGMIYEKALNYNNELRLVQHGSSAGKLPIEKSFISIDDGNIILSCLKESENKDGSLIMRIYNPTTKKIKTQVGFGFDILSIAEVTLEELFIKRIKSAKTFFETELNKKEIKTFRIIFEEESKLK